LIAVHTNKLHRSIKDLQRQIAVYEDEAAYKELFFILFNSLTRFATGILQSKEVAEEVVSDVFVSIWTDRANLNAIDDLQLYIFIAVKNNSIHKAKQLHKRTTVSIDEIDVEMESIYQTPEERVLSTESLSRIETAMNSLPQRARLILKLAKEDKMRYKDIAALLNISVKTVDNQLAIALKKLTTALGTPFRKKS
jgi:RNA polymerase sigma-70 factor (family 1)